MVEIKDWKTKRQGRLFTARIVDTHGTFQGFRSYLVTTDIARAAALFKDRYRAEHAEVQSVHEISPEILMDIDLD